MPTDNGFCQINDVVLDIPPERIQVNRQSFHNNYQTLRTRSSVKVRSGFSTLSIVMNAKFTDTTSFTSDGKITNGFGKLRDLVSQFRVTPFCYIENQYLRSSILGGDTSKNIALVLKQLEIVKDDSSTNTVEAFFHFEWFNYFPYLTNFTFKRDLFTSEEVDNPAESNPWKLLYIAEQERTGRGYEVPIKLNGTCDMVFTQYAQMSLESYNSLKKEVTALRNLRQSIIDNRVGRSSDSDRESSLSTNIFGSLSKDLGQPHAKILQEEIFGSTTSMNTNQNSLGKYVATEEVLDILDNTLAIGGNSRFSPVIDANEWRVTIVGGRLVRHGQDQTSAAGALVSREGLIEEEQITTEETVLLERDRVLTLENKGLILNTLSISFENILATIPLIGHPYPTFQHIGSVDAVVSMSISTTNENGLRAISEFYSVIEDQSLKFRGIPQGHRNVIIRNELINMCGLFEFIPNGLNLSTVPGAPGAYQIALELVNNPITSETAEEITPGQSFTTSVDLRARIANVLDKSIGRIPNNINTNPSLQTLAARAGLTALSLAATSLTPVGPLATTAAGALTSNFHLDDTKSYYTYLGEDGDRHSRFRNLCLEYGEKLGVLLGKLARLLDGPSDLFGNKEDFSNELFSLSNTDVPSIQRIQEDLYPIYKNQKRFVDSGISAPNLEALRLGAKQVINSGNEEAIKQWQAQREARLERGVSEEITSPLEEIAVENLNRLGNFINEYLSDWIQFSTEFLDKILFSDAIELPQFQEVRELMFTDPITSSSNAYPDFPLDSVIQLLRQNNDPALQAALELLQDKALQNQQLQKNITLSSLLNPDFYIFNHQNDTIGEIIGYDVINAASDAVYKAQTDTRIKEEKRWYTEIYDQKLLGQTKSDVVLRDIHRPDLDPLFWSSKGDDKQKEVQQDILDTLKAQGASVFHPDDLLDDTGQPCSIAAYKENYGDIELKQIDQSLDEQNIFSQRRGKVRLSPVQNFGNAQHRYGPSSIRFLSEQEYQGTPTPLDPNKIPSLQWPVQGGRSAFPPGSKFGSTRGGISTVPHLGIDIPAPKGTSVLAAATGQIITITERFEENTTTTFGARYLGISQQELERRKKLPVTDPLRQEVDNVNKKLLDKPYSKAVEIAIKHSGNLVTRYKHMLWDERIQQLSAIFHSTTLSDEDKEVLLTVEGGTEIGRVGSTGWSTGPHLHFETRIGGVNGASRDPLTFFDGTAYRSQGPSTGLDPRNESLFTKSIDQFEKDLRTGQGYGLIRAYPTFRLYFIESDIGERRRYSFDDFFSYSSVKEIQVIRSRKLPADLCVIDLTNISGVLSNRKFRDISDPDAARTKDGTISKESKDPRNTNTFQENPIASLMLQPGIQIQLRLGYSANPDELETVFNGLITEVQFTESDDLVRIVCQSFGLEMVQNVHGNVKKFGGFLSSTGRTAKILEELMAFPELVHFGRWELGNATNASVRGLLTTRWSPVPTPQDDNIFAPTGKGIRGLFDSTSEYVMFNTTIWDVFQEMTLRHPSYVAYPVPYESKEGPRMSMFFGLPDQLYFARDPSFSEDNAITGLKQLTEDSKKEVENDRTLIDKIADASIFALPFRDRLEKLINSDNSTEEGERLEEARSNWLSNSISTLALDSGIIKPFRNYHLVNSTQHIIQNNIQSSAHNTFNTVTLQYGDKGAKIDEDDDGNPSELKFKDLETFTLKCDAGLPDEDQREMFAQYPNCVGYEMAKRYSVALLYWSLKEGYQGNLIIIGNPRIKPYDICYLLDEYTRMYGPVEVEQVVHKFSQENGFITEITPDMVVHVNQLSTLSTSDAMSLIVETAAKRVGLEGLPTLIKNSGAGNALVNASIGPIVPSFGLLNTTFSPISNMLWNSSENSIGLGTSDNPFGFAFTFAFKKLITRTQLAHPFRYSPLVKDGKVLVGGLPTRKVDGIFIQGLGKWVKEATDGAGAMINDYWDKIHPNNWLNKSTGSLADTFFGEDKGFLRGR